MQAKEHNVQAIMYPIVNIHHGPHGSNGSKTKQLSGVRYETTHIILAQQFQAHRHEEICCQWERLVYTYCSASHWSLSRSFISTYWLKTRSRDWEPWSSKKQIETRPFFRMFCSRWWAALRQCMITNDAEEISHNIFNALTDLNNFKEVLFLNE